MKRKVMFLTLILMVVGTVSVGALVYHINDAADNLKQEYKADVEDYKLEKDFKIKNDVTHVTQEQIKRMESETEEYLQGKLGKDYQDSLNEKTNEIVKQTDKKIKEIKQYIDELIAE